MCLYLQPKKWVRMLMFKIPMVILMNININNLTMAAGLGMLNDPDYTKDCVARIIATREAARKTFESLGFEVLPSGTNFLFVRSPEISGEKLYLALKDKGVLVRSFIFRQAL